MKKVDDSYDPIISHAKAEKKKYKDPLKEAEQIAKIHITAYLEEQKRIRREAEEEARRKEEERQKKEDEILEQAKVLEDSGKEKEAQNLMVEIPLPERVDIPSEPEEKGVILKKIVDTEKINQLVECSKGQIKIPGIEIYIVYKWRIINRELIPKSYYKSTVAMQGKDYEK